MEADVYFFRTQRPVIVCCLQQCSLERGPRGTGQLGFQEWISGFRPVQPYVYKRLNTSLIPEDKDYFSCEWLNSMVLSCLASRLIWVVKQT